MFLSKNNLYNPFTAPSLGFFTKIDPSKENETLLMMIDDIDLYHQPVEDPILGFIFLVFGVITLVVGEGVQFQLYKTVTKEKGLVKEVTQFYTLVQMIGYPILIAFISSTDFIHPLSAVLGSWYCFIFHYLAYFYFYTLLLHSFVVATMRYVFIVHQNWVQKYGKEKIKRIFIIFNVLCPILMVLWQTCDNMKPFLFMARCNGNSHEKFLIFFNSEIFKSLSCYSENFDVSCAIRKTGCITKVVLTVLMGLNVSEGFIYYAIFSHMHRLIFYFVLSQSKLNIF